MYLILVHNYLKWKKRVAVLLALCLLVFSCPERWVKSSWLSMGDSLREKKRVAGKCLPKTCSVPSSRFFTASENNQLLIALLYPDTWLLLPSSTRRGALGSMFFLSTVLPDVSLQGDQAPSSSVPYLRGKIQSLVYAVPPIPQLAFWSFFGITYHFLILWIYDFLGRALFSNQGYLCGCIGWTEYQFNYH